MMKSAFYGMEGTAVFPVGDENPTQRTPVVNWLFIIINIVVFVLELRNGGGFVEYWSFIPERLYALLQGGDDTHALATIFSAMFMHAGWAHILGNMLFLWVFGDNVEDMFGHVPYAIFYLICGVGATLIQYYAGPQSPVPNLGASGAISGVLAAYLVMFPWARVRLAIWPFVLFIGTIPVPALVLLGVWFFIQLSAGYQSLGAVAGSEGGVAYWAHVGGFLVGFVLVFLFRPRRSQHVLPYRPYG